MTGRRRSELTPRGQSLVEFALILPFVLLLLFGILDFGRAVAAYSSVSNAARTAVRVAIVDQNLTAITDAAEREAVGFSPITVTSTPCAEMGCVYAVTVSYEFMPATPVINRIVGPVTLASTSRMPVERERDTSSP